MSAALPDLVDCKRLAADDTSLAREYSLREMPRIKDMIVDEDGAVHAIFAFATLPTGRASATVDVQCLVKLVCRRCSQPFEFPVESSGEVEFVADEAAELGAELEPYPTKNGWVSLRELAEEEVLMALPAAATCGAAAGCGSGAVESPGEDVSEAPAETRRPFAGLKDLLKKT